MIALTGPSGFLGQALLLQIPRLPVDLAVRPLWRQDRRGRPDGMVVGNLDGTAIDPAALAACKVLIHTAARAHRMGESGDSALAAYRQVNVQGSLSLARAAVAAGVRRLVYVSSIKACAEGHGPGQPLRPDQDCAPQDPYGISKHEAEQALTAFCAAEGMELIILRPPLIHGPGAKGNLHKLLSAIAAGKRLPLGSVRGNRRSMLGLHNAVDAILTAATAPFPGLPSVSPRLREEEKREGFSRGHGDTEKLREEEAELGLGGPRAGDAVGGAAGATIAGAGEVLADALPAKSHAGPVAARAGHRPALRADSRVRVYHLCDAGVISTRRLVEVLAEGMGVQPRLLPLPRWAALAAALPLGKGAAVRRLFGDLEVDGSDFCRDFNWQPSISLEDGLRAMARAWKDSGGW